MAAIAAGAIVGFIVGGEVGRSMDREDALRMDQAMEYASDGDTIAWTSDHQDYAVRPEGFIPDIGRPLLPEVPSDIDGRNQKAETYCTACRQPDGSWQIVN